METKGINILEEALKRYNGSDATISISHKLYGNQKLQCTLDCLCGDNRIGFKVNQHHVIFIYKHDLECYGVEDSIYFADKLMEIRIKLHEQ